MPQQQHGWIDAFWMKMIMAVLMVLDHLYYNLFPTTLLWGHIAARTVAPVFCYLMTEGMTYTRDRPRYLLRMLGFALAMLAGNAALYALYGEWIENSILMELAIGGGLIFCIDELQEAQGSQRFLWVVAIPALLAASLFFEGAYTIPLMALIFYYLRERPVAMWSVFFLSLSATYLLYFWDTGELIPGFWVCLSIIPIRLYNGKRGYNGAFAKYFFYVFYPLHIWVIFLIEKAVL